MRRRVLGPKRLTFLVALVLFLSFPHTARPASAAPRSSGIVVANEVAQPDPARSSGQLSRPSALAPVPALGAADGAAGVGSTDAAATLLFTSDVVGAGQLFDRVGVHWIAARGSEDGIFVELRSSADGSRWGEWQRFDSDEDMADLGRNEWYAGPYAVDPSSRYAQYRVWLTGGDPDALVRVSLTFMDATDLNAGPVVRLLGDVTAAIAEMAAPSVAAAAVGPSKILARADWGADESLMQWTPQYQKPHTKAVIHHTVTDDGGTNVAATIRGIYYYHAVTRGWGDIGYNYLVDKFGNIWTGRQGGDHVTGGHAYGWNNGAFGVAAIGDYSVNAPTGQLQGALANVIALKFAQYGIQPFGNDFFVHQEQKADGSWIDVGGNPPNMQGHRDANYVVGQTGGQTACPGGALYNMLAGLRTMAQNAATAGFTNLVRFDPAMPRGTYPGSLVNVPTTVTNRGVNTIPAGTGVSYKILKGGTPVTQGPTVPLPGALPPGATATVTLPLSGPAVGGYVARFDLVTNGVAWSELYNTPSREMWLKSADWSANWVSDNIPNSFGAGETKTITVTVNNDGGRTWNAAGTDPVVATYAWTSTATGNKFPGANKQVFGGDVAPGQTVTFSIPITAPTYPTNYTLALDLEKTNEFHFADRGVDVDNTSIAVRPDFQARYAVTPATFALGAATNVAVIVTNAGKGVFPITNATPVTLGYHWYDAAGKVVVFDGPRTKLPADLGPGQSVSLTASVMPPTVGGTYRLAFDLVQEGVTWFSQAGVPTGDMPVTIVGRTYGATYQPAVTTLAVTGAQAAVPITIVNSGNFTWPAAGANPITLSYHWQRPDGSAAVWDGLRTRLAADVPAGGSVVLGAAIAFPATAGTFTLRWDLVEEGVAWFSGKGVPTFNQSVAVETPKPFSYGSSMLPSTPPTMATRMTQSVPVRIQNLSSADWDAAIGLSYHWVDGAGRVVVWDGLRTPVAGIKVNEVRDVVAQVAGPPSAGAYTLRWDIVREGAAWFSSQGDQMPAATVAVAVPAYGALYAPAATTLTATAGATVSVPVTVTNTGSLVWDPAASFAFAYHVTNASGTVVWNGLRTGLAGPVSPGQSATVSAGIVAPTARGSYTVRLDLVQEGVTWFSDQGVPTAPITVVVQ